MTSPSVAIRSCATTRSSGTPGSSWRRSDPSCSSTSSSATTTAGRSTATRARRSTSAPRASRTSRPTAPSATSGSPATSGCCSRSTRSIRPRRSATGHDRRTRLHPAVRDGAAQRLGDVVRRALRRGAHGAQPRRGQGRVRPRHRRGRPDQVPPQRRRRGLGDRHRVLRRADQGRRLRPRAVPREGIARGRQVRLAQAQPGRQARHRRRPARRQGDQGDRRRAQRARRARPASAHPATRCSAPRAS